MNLRTLRHHVRQLMTALRQHQLKLPKVKSLITTGIYDSIEVRVCHRAHAHTTVQHTFNHTVLMLILSKRSVPSRRCGQITLVDLSGPFELMW